MKQSFLYAGAMMLISQQSWAGTDNAEYVYGSHMMGGSFGHGILGIAVMVLFCIGVIALIVMAVRRLTGNGEASKLTSAFDILQERLANGDINTQEYETLKTALGK